jgi:hypothetical protein
MIRIGLNQLHLPDQFAFAINHELKGDPTALVAKARLRSVHCIQLLQQSI